MKKRNLWFMAFMTIITFGLYSIYWVIVTKFEMVDRGMKIPSIFLPFAPLLGLVLIALIQIGYHFYFVDEDSGNTVATTIINTLSLLIGFISLVATIPVTIYWVYKYCKAVDVITKGKASFDFSFWTAIVLSILGVSFIWPFLLQPSFNKT